MPTMEYTKVYHARCCCQRGLLERVADDLRAAARQLGWVSAEEHLEEVRDADASASRLRERLDEARREKLELEAKADKLQAEVAEQAVRLDDQVKAIRAADEMIGRVIARSHPIDAELMNARDRLGAAVGAAAPAGEHGEGC